LQPCGSHGKPHHLHRHHTHSRLSHHRPPGSPGHTETAPGSEPLAAGGGGGGPSTAHLHQRSSASHRHHHHHHRREGSQEGAGGSDRDSSAVQRHLSRASHHASTQRKKQVTHIVVALDEGSSITISTTFLADWLRDVADMAPDLRSGRLDGLLSGLPSNPADLDPNIIHVSGLGFGAPTLLRHRHSAPDPSC
jgi:hypothetical protein